MGYIRITKPDGTEIVLGDEFDDETFIEICDVCNDPRPAHDLRNVGSNDDHGAIWECSKCHGISGLRKDG